jgi:RHS repeat-associated protein
LDSGGTTETYGYNTTTGNLETKAGTTLNYADTAHKHAVTSVGSNTYAYDANGNQTTRVVNGQTYTLSYDAENRLVSVTGPSLTTSFVYDADGNRVKSIAGSTTTLFIGGHYEVNTTANEITKYYMAGASRIAMRKYIIPASNTLTYLLGDHLGSTSLAVDSVTAAVIETRYKPWGEVRYTTTNKTLPTGYTFTGQYSYVSDDATDLGNAGFGLMFYNARWYDPYLNHFTQPDTIVPDPSNTQDWNRYAYARNNPIRYNDPSGHEPGDCYDRGYCKSKKPNPPNCKTLQAICLGLNWLTGTGDDSAEENRIIFDSGEDMTQELMRSIGVQEARDEFVTNGGVQSDRDDPPDWISDPYGYKAELEDYRTNFIRENVTATYLGSYTVTIINNGNGTATFYVDNTSGLQSLTHEYIPGTNYGNPTIQDFVQGNVDPARYPSTDNGLSLWGRFGPSGLLNDIQRDTFRPMGAVYQSFIWTELFSRH